MIDIDNEIKLAIKSKDATRLTVLRALKTSIATFLSAKGRGDKPLTQDEEWSIIRATIKKHDDSIGAYTRAKAKPRFAEKEQAEKNTLESFLPEPLEQHVIDQIISDGIEKSGAKTKRELQLVMDAIDILAIHGRMDLKVLRGLIAKQLA